MNKDIKSLYIHIPFCDNICDYCDFTKLQYFHLFADQYLVALAKEIESYHIENNLKTIYIGGGTPTSLSDEQFEKLLLMVFPYTKGVYEYTIEANPESLSKQKLILMKKYGVNRLSIGVESTNDEILKSINRHHTWKDVQSAVSNARNIGFNNINVDLILGLPQVSKALLNKDIDNILSLNVEHISCYSLSIHEHTMFYLKGIKEQNGEIERELYDIIHNRLQEKGYVHYEVSNWCKPHYNSEHNMTYWRNERYYGLGLGASGYINNVRYKNTVSLTNYLKENYLEEKEIVNKNDERTYELMLRLRTNEGLNLNDFKEKFQEDLLSDKKDIINDYILKGYMNISSDKSNMSLTYEGKMILDTILMSLI